MAVTIHIALFYFFNDHSDSSGGGFKLFLRNRDIRRVNIVNEPKHENTKKVTNSFVDVFAWKSDAHNQIVQSIPRVGRIASLALPASFV